MNISTVAPSSIFFISFKIKPDVTSIDFTTKIRIFTSFWYQNCKNCKVVVLPIKIWIWLKYSWNLLMCSHDICVLYNMIIWVVKFPTKIVLEIKVMPGRSKLEKVVDLGSGPRGLLPGSTTFSKFDGPGFSVLFSTVSCLC